MTILGIVFVTVVSVLLFIILCQHMTVSDLEQRLARKPLGRLSKTDHTAMLQMTKDMIAYHSDQYTKTRMGFLLTKLESIDG